MSFKVLTEERLSTAAVEAFSAELRVVGTDSLADLEILDTWSDGGNDTDSLVAWNKRELGGVSAAAMPESERISYPRNEFAIVDMQVCAANTAS